MIRKDLPVLGHEAKPGAGDAMWLEPGYDTTPQHHFSASCRREAHDGFHGGRFAGPVAAEQRHGFTLLHPQIDTEQDLAGAVIDIEILDLNDGLRTHTAASA